MKVVILCGGFGIQLPGQSDFIPKAMIPFQGKPIIYSILKHYSFYGFKEFLLCTGRGGALIENFFSAPSALNDLEKSLFASWNVEIVDTGEQASTASRLMQVKDKIQTENFILSYSDIISDINLSKLVIEHDLNKRMLTMTGAYPTTFHGVITFEGNQVVNYDVQKPTSSAVKAGYFVCSSKLFEFLTPFADEAFEGDFLQQMISKNEVSYFNHVGHWKHFESHRQVIEMNSEDLTKKPTWSILESGRQDKI